MKKLLVLSLLFLSACGPQLVPQSPDPRTIAGVDPTFQPYIDLYMQTKGSGLRYDIPMAFAPQSGNTIGVCTRWTSGYRQIAIDPIYWNASTTTWAQRVNLIFHELGHCDLNRDHIETKLSSGWPTSLMYPMNYGFISTMQSYYFAELFNPAAATTSASTLASHHDGCVHDIEVVE